MFRKEFLENLRERRTLISALLIGPLLVPGLFAMSLSLHTARLAAAYDKPVPLAVAHAERAPNLLQFLRQYGVQAVGVDYEDAGARAAVLEHRQPLVLMIPQEFGGNLLAGAPATLALYSDGSNLSGDARGERVRALITEYGAMLARLRVTARGVDPTVLTPLAVQDVDVSTPASRSVALLGMLSYMLLLIMLMGGIYLALDTTAGERERGTLEALLTVPAPRTQLLYGKVLATCAYMVLSLVLTVAAFSVLLRYAGLERFGMTVGLGPLTGLLMILSCVPMAPVGAALMTIVAASTRTMREAQTYLGLMLLVPTLPLIYAQLHELRPSAFLMMVPSLSQHFLVRSLLRSEPLPPGYVLLSVGATLAVAFIMVRIAGRLYQREELLG